MARRHGTILSNKKGSAQDLLFIGIVLLFASVTILIGYKISDEINTEIQAKDIADSHGKTAVSSLNSNYPGVIDNSFLLLMIGLGIGALIFASLVRVHPIFIPFFIIMLALIIFFSGIFSNIYQEMADNSVLSTQADNLTFISTIMEYLPLIIGIFGTLLMVVMHKLWRDQQYEI